MALTGPSGPRTSSRRCGPSTIWPTWCSGAGRWTEAGDLLDRMGRLIERSGREDWRPSWHVLRATYYAHVVGDLLAAQAELVDLGSPTQRTWAALVSAELAMEARDPSAAATLLSLLQPWRPTRRRSSSPTACAPGWRPARATRTRCAACWRHWRPP